MWHTVLCTQNHPVNLHPSCFCYISLPSCSLPSYLDFLQHLKDVEYGVQVVTVLSPASRWLLDLTFAWVI